MSSQVVMSFALLESDCGAERRNDFAVLIWEHGSQVELELASHNVRRWAAYASAAVQPIPVA